MLPELKLEKSSVVETRYWHALKDGRVQCDLCPRECKLKEGARGLCFVRLRQNDRIMLATYGRSSGFCVDPVEKKPLYHFLPGTPILSFGTAGCNLACKFCQNWDISKSRADDTLADEASPRLIARAAKSLGCSSVAFTYNDPVVFMEYAIDVADACHELGLKAVAVTAGEINPRPREEFYRQNCGGDLRTVLDTLVYLKTKTSVWLEITTLLIPGLNDATATLADQCRWIAAELGPDVPLHFTAFHPDYKMTGVPHTPLTTLVCARDIARAAGLRYVYTGNVRDELGSQTICGGCGATVIGRDGYRVTHWALNDEGGCRSCGTRCPGVFDGPPGSWGSRRLPVRLADFEGAPPRSADIYSTQA